MTNELMRNGSGCIDPTAYAAMKNIDKEQREMQYKRGRIFEYDVKPGDTRTALIVSADHRAGEEWLNIIVLSDELKNDKDIPVAGRYADCGAVSFAWASRFGSYIDKASDAEMRKIDAGIMTALGLERNPEPATVTPPAGAAEFRRRARGGEDRGENIPRTLRAFAGHTCGLW